MRVNKTIALACAISAAVALSGCHRDEADEADHATTTVPVDAPAPAASSVATTTLSFDEMDKNHDGSITPDELQDSDVLKQEFSAADTNGDGKLSQDEVAKHMAAKPAE